jgi:hypothetical protein
MTGKQTISIALCLALGVGLIFSGCSKQAIVPGGEGHAGVYALVSVDGKDVPASVSHDGVALQVLSGTFVIHDDGRCSSKTVFVPPSGSEMEREVSATYSKDGDLLTMQWEGAGMTTGSIDGNTFTMNNEGMIFVYRK